MVTADLIGSSPRFRALLNEVDIVAAVDCAVLLRGETGTGKEVIARAIHDASPRRHGRFVALNCAAMPSGLVESELFGHERGAFTGAVTQTMGRFQAADHGTLFLDEIADLPLELQPKLLRVLQEQRFERVGSPRTLQVDVRVIAATNQDLWGMVQERKFRADLYYRLNVIPIEIPPLRERKADIEPLVWHFVEEFTNRQGKTIDRISEGDIDLLKSYHWPGNIRELQNLIERAVIMTSGPDLRISFGSLNHQKTWCTNRTLAEAEREYIVEALRQVDWVVGGSRGAAARLGLPRTTLISRMRKLGIVRGTESRSDSETRPAAFAAAASY
jgi:transcriptional regulator with GAF, ATPase, and Fis domain